MSMFSVTGRQHRLHAHRRGRRQGEEPDRGRGQPGPRPAGRRPARRCSGFSYEMFFDTDLADDDVKTEHGGRHGRDRPRERAAPRRRDARLQGRAPGRRVPDQQPERRAQLRLRPVLLLTQPSLRPNRVSRRSTRQRRRSWRGCRAAAFISVAAERAVEPRLDRAGAVDAEQPRLARQAPRRHGR